MVYVATLLATLLLSAIFTPGSIFLARKWGVLDQPGERRVHHQAIPRLGGMAIFAAFWIVAFWQLGLTPMLQGLFWGSLMIFAVGIADDIWSIRPLVKLGFQVLAACIPLFFGLSLSQVTLPVVGTLELGVWGALFIVLWIIGVVNTVNISDGLDGLAAGICIIASLILAWSAYRIEQEPAVIILITLAGAALGFLFYNFHPAKVFMGDGGSMFLGYILGTVSIWGLLKTATVLGLIFPLLVLGVPIADIAFAVIRRRWKKRSIIQADRGHLHHRLLDIGFNQRQAVVTLYFISLCFGLAAICCTYELWLLAAALLILDAVLVLQIMFRRMPFTGRSPFNDPSRRNTDLPSRRNTDRPAGTPAASDGSPDSVPGGDSQEDEKDLSQESLKRAEE